MHTHTVYACVCLENCTDSGEYLAALVDWYAYLILLLYQKFKILMMILRKNGVQTLLIANEEQLTTQIR